MIIKVVTPDLDIYGTEVATVLDEGVWYTTWVTNKRNAALPAVASVHVHMKFFSESELFRAHFMMEGLAMK